MQYQHLLIEEKENILIVTINREKALNALNTATMLDLQRLFAEDAPQRNHIRGIILTGAGDRSFVAGADISEFLDMDAARGAEMARRGQDIFFLIERFPKPVIAAVNGFALGGGCELAMACHLRIAGEKARFGQPEVNLGLIPGYGGTQRLVQYIGKTKALELLMTADMIDAQEAHRLGLVNAVVPAGEEVAAAEAMLQKIAAKAPLAIAGVIASVNAYYHHDEDGFDREVSEFGLTAGTEDFREGASAFLEKRKASFSGH